MGKLIDTDDIKFYPSKVGMKTFDYVCRVDINSMPGVDVESLDVVKNLRSENKKLKNHLESMNKSN